MRTAAVLVITAKLASLASLPILALGYLFFLGSHDEITHLYAWVTAIGLVLTVVCSPANMPTIGHLYAVIAVSAIVLGAWRIHEHLSFFQGPEYSAATFCAIAGVAIAVGYSGCRYISLDRHAQ